MEMHTSPTRVFSSRRSTLRLYFGLFITLLLQLSSVTAAGRFPFCDPSGNMIYFVDRDNLAITVYRPDLGHYESALIYDTTINYTLSMSFAIPIAGARHPFFVAGFSGSVGLVQWNTLSTKPCKPKFYIEVSPSGIIASGTTDASGLLWVVTPDTRKGFGSLSTVDASGTVFMHRKSLPGLVDIFMFSTGRFYYMDNTKNVIHGKDYDVQTQTISDTNEVIIDLGKFTGAPGGMTVDKDGNLWVTFNTNFFMKFDSKSGINHQNITVEGQASLNAAAFCGRKMDVLYGTSSLNTGLASFNFQGAMSGFPGVPAKFPLELPQN